MSKHIDEIEGIGAAFSAKLQAVEIKTVEALLEAGATPKGRKELEEKSGIGHHHLLKWVNQADLFRIDGVGRQYASRRSIVADGHAREELDRTSQEPATRRTLLRIARYRAHSLH
jgi:hypothetical protein